MERLLRLAVRPLSKLDFKEPLPTDFAGDTYPTPLHAFAASLSLDSEWYDSLLDASVDRVPDMVVDELGDRKRTDWSLAGPKTTAEILMAVIKTGGFEASVRLRSATSLAAWLESHLPDWLDLADHAIVKIGFELHAEITSGPVKLAHDETVK